MKSPRSWHRLAHLPPTDVLRVQDALLRTRLREELMVGSAYYRRAALERSLDPRRVQGLRDWAELPLTEPSALAADPGAFVLKPSPGRIREHWPFSRKLALAVGGRRSRALLERSYVPVLSFGAIELSAHDVEVMGEVGARALEIAKCAGKKLALDLTGHARWVAGLGAVRAGVHVNEEGVGAIEWSTDRLGELSTWGPVETRSVFVECTPGAGFHTSPDLAYFEEVEGEIVYTDLAGHGTALTRYRTGVRGEVDREICGSCGRSLPRVILSA